jgi:hypothetical protein
VKVEVPRVSEEVPQLREETVGYVPQTEDCDVLTPALGTAGADGVLDGGVFRFERCV